MHVCTVILSHHTGYTLCVAEILFLRANRGLNSLEFMIFSEIRD